MSIIINRNSRIIAGEVTEPVKKAIENLQRDIGKTCVAATKKGTDIKLIPDMQQEKECFLLKAEAEGLALYAGDELGFIYGIYEISRSILGIRNFWFWNDQKFEPKEEYPVPAEYEKQSIPSAVKLRGWFVNDEVLLHKWSVNRRAVEAWEMVFEALLRCGGNLVIPGTDSNSRHYRKIASDMGLYITHHHAEPLGAEMFARAYPNLNPSYEEHGEKFRKLWEEGVEEQKEMHVIWNIGFRGQGDCPFWVDDPRYETPKSRGELMSRLIKVQYDIVKERIPDAICCTNLYGETMELYRDGYLTFPEDVIKIWADNGFGKMVTRRQENHNPRVYALPKEEDLGKHGIYYHVSFYDLQAANHITMLPNSPEFVCRELNEVLEHHVKDYWIVNCSNVKPHVYFLDLIAQIWRDGTADIEKHRNSYVADYYGEDNVRAVASILEQYPKYALAYGEQEDEHAGEQFSNHVARMLISQFMTDKNVRAEGLLWASDADTLEGQNRWYGQLCKKATSGYQEYLLRCEGMDSVLTEEARTLYRDSLALQVQIHCYCYTGAYLTTKSIEKGLEGDYQRAFYLAGKARKAYLQANQSMRNREHGKWQGFYANECLTDVKQTAWVLEGYMSYLRNLGDGPHFYQWQREFLYAEEDKKVLLILNMENHLKDMELFELMEEKWGN